MKVNNLRILFFLFVFVFLTFLIQEKDKKRKNQECGDDCLRRMYTCGYYFMRGTVFALIWVTSTASCIWVITPGCGGVGFLSALCCAYLFFTAVQTTRFYLLACNSDPGGLTREDWSPSAEELKLMQSVVGNKTWAEIKEQKLMAYCRKCERHRPLRAHHCADCERCVLRQDHHW